MTKTSKPPMPTHVGAHAPGTVQVFLGLAQSHLVVGRVSDSIIR